MSMLSVCMITYNHELFISEAIESVIRQKTEFDFELIISDDCSTDSTSSIIQSYKRQFPEIIRIILRPKNLGMIPNFLQTVIECKGKYVAFLEGDDYWTDDYKLQKQVDLLERKPDIAVCFHPVKIINQHTGIFETTKTKKINRVTKTQDILLFNYIATCSVVYRNLDKGVFPDWIRPLSMGDWPVHILNSLNGDILFLPDYMAVYRLHGTSAWSANLTSISGKIRNTESKLELFLALKDHLPTKWQGIISSQIHTYRKLIDIYLHLEEGKGFSITAVLWLIWKSMNRHFDSRVCLNFLVKTILP